MMGSDDVVALPARVALVDCEDAAKWDDHLDVWYELPRGHVSSTDTCTRAAHPVSRTAAADRGASRATWLTLPAAATRVEGATR